MGYHIVSENPTLHTLEVTYKNSKSDVAGMHRLLECMCKQLNCKMEALEENVYRLSEDPYGIIYRWQESKGFSIKYLTNESDSMVRAYLQNYFDWLNEKDAQMTIQQMNTYLKRFSWCDFHLGTYDGWNLKLYGTLEFSYPHQFEAIFEGTTYICCSSSWRVAPLEEVIFSLASQEEIEKINTFYHIEGGYNIMVRIKAEGIENPFYIGCYDIQFKAE